MRKKTILVTGGGGFIGSHLCERLLTEGNDVICLDNFFTGSKNNIRHLLQNPAFELIRHDVTMPISLEVVVPDVDDEEADVEIGLYSYRKGLYDLIARGMNPGTDETAGESEITANLNAEENKGYKAQMFKVVLSIRDESDYKILVTPTDGTAPTDYASVET